MTSNKAQQNQTWLQIIFSNSSIFISGVYNFRFSLKFNAMYFIFSVPNPIPIPVSIIKV